MQSIQIRPQANLNGTTFLVTGASIAIISLLLIAWTGLNHLAIYALTLSGLVTLLIGLFKLREPPFSLIITPEQVIYRHRYGQWQLDWDNIQRFDQPSVSHNWSQQPLPFIGFRLKDPDPVLKSVSLRLASRLMLEQRDLLFHAMKEQCPDGRCASAEHLLEDDNYDSPAGTSYTGLLGMLGNRMARLHRLLGYDLYIPTNALDRDPDEFLALLRKCQSSRFQYLQNDS